jgi:hypothetical protein
MVIDPDDGVIVVLVHGISPLSCDRDNLALGPTNTTSVQPDDALQRATKACVETATALC